MSNDELKCVACGEEVEDGFAIGRLCYQCIEKAAVYVANKEKEERAKKLQDKLARYTFL